MKNDQFLVFSAVWILFPKFFGRLLVTYVKTAQNKISVTYSFVPNCFLFVCLFYDQGLQGEVFKVKKKNDHF